MSKQKNARKPNIFSFIAITILFVGAAGIIASTALYRPSLPPAIFLPETPLFYGSSGKTYKINFQASERTPVDFVDVRETPTNLYRELWFVQWERIEGETAAELMLDDVTGKEAPRSLGRFYPVDAELSWSPDGAWVLFAAYDPTLDPSVVESQSDGDNNAKRNSSELWLVHRETGEIKQLTDNDVFDGEAEFSPDGTQIVYISDVWRGLRSTPQIKKLVLATGDVYSPTQQHAQNPTWSPDGQWIAFEAVEQKPQSQPPSEQTRVYIMRQDGSVIQPITPQAYDEERFITWQYASEGEGNATESAR
jgi:Tol biopolymer transport system component